MMGTETVTLTVKEVAELLGVASGTIYAMVREAQIPNFKVRGRVLFHREVIDSWMKDQMKESVNQ